MHHNDRSSYGQADRQSRAREFALRLIPFLPRYVLSLASLLVLAAVFKILILDDLSSSMGKLVGDEAGYNFGIARNVVLGYGFSFDRVDATNGFNPLLVVLLVATYWAFLPEGLLIESCYRAGVGITFLILLAVSWLFVKVFEALVEGCAPGGWEASDRRLRADPKVLGRSALFMFLGLYAFKQVHGVDYLLALFLILAYSRHILRHGALASDWRVSSVAGALLGLSVLARVDSLSFVGSTYVVLVLMAIGGRGSWKPVLVSLAATTAIVLPYMVALRFEFGIWLPVSALLVTSFPTTDIETSIGVLLRNLDIFDQFSFGVSLVLSLILIVRVVLQPASWARFPADRPATVLLILSAYVAARLLWMVFYTRMDALSGYLAVSSSYNVFAFLYLWMDRGEGRLPGRWTEWVSAFMVIMGLLGLAIGTILWRRSVESNLSDGSQLAFARAVRYHTLPSDLLYGETFGMAGFLSDRRWMNGEGVVGTTEHYRILRYGDTNELYGYLDERGVTHIVTMDRSAADLGTIVYQQRLRDRGNAVAYLVRLAPGWVGKKESLRDTNFRKSTLKLRHLMVQETSGGMAFRRGVI